jgi:hypothetical protein
MTKSDNGRVEDWLRRFRWALSAMPAAERDDVVAETRAHLNERIDAGQGAEAALAALGPADAYARSFIDEMELTGALASQRSGDLLRVVLRRAHRSLVAAIAFLLLLVIGGLALGFAGTAIGKAVDPGHFGLWVGGANFFIGQTNHPERMRELLGGWLYPVAAAALGLCWLAGRLVLLWAARVLRGR